MTQAQLNNRQPKPPSASHFGFSFVAVLAGLSLLVWLQARNPAHSYGNAFAACCLIAGLIVVWDVLLLRTYRRASVGLAEHAQGASLARVLTKLLGLAATLGAVALLYWLFPEYHGSFYNPYWMLLQWVLPWLLLAAPLYFWWMDGRLADPHDSYWHLGAVLLRQTRADWPRLRQHFLGWLVKAFFLPLMVVYMGQEVRAATHSCQQLLNGHAMGWYDCSYHGIFTLDVLLATVGYCMTFRILDTHIRSAEPTLLGWWVALLCYQPFWSITGDLYLHYGTGVSWGPWLAGYPSMQYLWGSAILLLLLVYVLATVSFGLRFSNLTHRGIITSGPYRYMKHPAYVSKNLSWWLISVPFIFHGSWGETLRSCLLLGGVNLIYYLRAKTEERHLRVDPAYQAYSDWIDQHGLWARLRGKLRA